jgi:hypothetical protein
VEIQALNLTIMKFEIIQQFPSCQVPNLKYRIIFSMEKKRKEKEDKLCASKREETLGLFAFIEYSLNCIRKNKVH